MKKIIYAVLSFAPVLALAQPTTTGLGGVQSLLTALGKIINNVIPVLFALAIVYFFWGLVKYIGSAGDAKAAAEGKSIMIWGVIAIAVMASLFGLIAWLQGTLGIGTNSTNVNYPGVTIP